MKNAKQLGAYLLIAVAMAVAVLQISDRSFDRIHAAATQECQRVNVLRAQSNLDSYVIFRVLTLSANRERELTQADIKTAKDSVRSADLLNEQANEVTITHLTNCDLAVNHTSSYTFPIAQPLGNPKTGEISPASQEIINMSRSVVQGKISPSGYSPPQSPITRSERISS